MNIFLCYKFMWLQVYIKFINILVSTQIFNSNNSPNDSSAQGRRYLL